MRVEFEETAWKDFVDWGKADLKTRRRIEKLIQEIQRSPYVGSGRPEALKHEFSGC